MTLVVGIVRIRGVVVIIIVVIIVVTAAGAAVVAAVVVLPVAAAIGAVGAVIFKVVNERSTTVSYRIEQICFSLQK